MTNEKVILVDEQDQAIGEMEKLQAHREARLHRAFSVLLFNSKGEMLLQQRALHKYHSAGLWTNTCCSHPRPGEEVMAAAKRRLMEEMGMEAELEHKGKFIYKVGFENGLTEHELDHVFFGKSDQHPVINKEEVNDFKWMDPKTLKSEMQLHPEQYTYWFRIALEKFNL